MSEILEFAGNLTDKQVMAITLAFMLIVFRLMVITTGSIALAAIPLAVIPCLNLAIIFTEPILQTGAKPLLPLWMNIVILLAILLIEGTKILGFRPSKK